MLSLHVLLFGVVPQAPVLGLHEAVKHGFVVVHDFGFPPVHTPDWQLSVWVQRSPSLQVLPLGTGPVPHTLGFPAQVAERH